jgi:hypothetical protein
MGRPDPHSRSWAEWKKLYPAAYARGVNRQCAGATDKLFSKGAANLAIILTEAPQLNDAITGALDNLALAATRDKTIIQQLMEANLLLTQTVTTLTAANNKLMEKIGRMAPNAPGGATNTTSLPLIWGQYYWTHGYKVNHTSKSCFARGQKPNHKETAAIGDTQGGSSANKYRYKKGNSTA